ncbi:uncharacterized protein LOC143260295 [Megalopta genalis]|uniref:uncharacterized protein LOC143260295 n=1 Tax=Megalopta genalis TaxID=115081 RepID=UPI003FCF7F6B
MQDIIDVVEKIDDEMETIGLRKQHWAQIKPTAPTKQKILISLGSSLPHNITMAVQLSFIIWVRYIGVKFRQVNKLLEAMIEALDLPKPRRFLGEADDRLIERETRNDLRGNVQKIMIAKKCHLDLVWAAKRVNKFYGFQLVLVTLVELMLLIIPLFMLNFMIWNHLPKEDVLFDGFPALIVIFVIWMRIVHLHGNCIHTTNEAKAAGFLLCRLYDSSTTTKFRAEVQNFTQQVLQTPLVFSLAGSIFAYLFVIVQLASTQWYLRQELSWNATDLNATLTGET